MKNLNVFTKNRLGVLMLFTLLTFVFSSFTSVLEPPKKRKKITILKVQTPNIQGEPQSRGGVFNFQPDYKSNLGCLNAFVYEVENGTDLTLHNVVVSISQKYNGANDETFHLSSIPSGATRKVIFYAASNGQSGNQPVSFSVTVTTSNQSFNELFHGILGNCEDDSSVGGEDGR